MLGLAASVGISPAGLLRAGDIEQALLLEAIPEALQAQKRFIRALAVEIHNVSVEGSKKG